MLRKNQLGLLLMFCTVNDVDELSSEMARTVEVVDDIIEVSIETQDLHEDTQAQLQPEFHIVESFGGPKGAMLSTHDESCLHESCSKDNSDYHLQIMV